MVRGGFVKRILNLHHDSMTEKMLSMLSLRHSQNLLFSCAVNNV